MKSYYGVTVRRVARQRIHLSEWMNGIGYLSERFDAMVAKTVTHAGP